MLKFFQRKDLMVRIFLGAVLVLISLGMLVYLIPGGGVSTEVDGDVVAQIGDQSVTTNEVRRQLAQIESRGAIPRTLESFYAQQIVNQLIFQRMLELEAKRLGVQVSDEERAERIRQLLPTAYVGDAFVGMERYAADVQLRFQMSVPEFEELVREGLLEEKFRRLVTDGVRLTPDDVREEFRRRNEKVRIEFVAIKPEGLESKVGVSEADLAAYFEKNKSRYVLPERRTIRFALLDLGQIRQRANVSEDDLREYYNQNLARYTTQNRVHVEHILFKTVGKTDAEIEEIRKKAEDVLKKARRGTKFEDLARQYSEDTSKDKGGDLGWIVQGQTVPEFERVAFSLPKGAISDLVKTQYGFHILKVLDHETARKQSLDEVRASILSILQGQKTEGLANDEADKIAAAVRQSTRGSLDDIAKKFGMTLAETKPVAANDPVPELGNSQELRDAIFRLRQGDLSAPIRTDRGIIVLTAKDLQPSHPATLAEVREQVTTDYRREKAVELARTRAAELAKRSQSGEALAAAAKALGFEVKTSESFARTGSVPDAGSARQLAAAFSLSVGQTGAPVQAGSNWIVFRVVSRDEPKPEDFDKQRKQIEADLLQSKRSLAYEAFRAALESRLRREGKLKMNADVLKRLTTPS